jgi:5-formyltetrahydrofolate cyclo-ligase
VRSPGGPKRSLRRRIIGLRDALDPDTRRDGSLLIEQSVKGLPEWRSARTVHVFASFGSEVDTAGLILSALEEGRRAVLPVVRRGTHELEHAAIRARSDLVRGYMGIPEPGPHCERVEPACVDLVIVPGVAFDEAGGRLGYGGGFYDRFLADTRAPRVGVAFGVQIVGSVPRAAHDLPVDVVVTEAGVIRPTRGTSPGRSTRAGPPSDVS